MAGKSKEVTDSRPVLLSGGSIHTFTGDGDPVDKALVVRDGYVVASGDESEMRSVAGSDHLRVDLDGATVLPGLIDTHPHLLHLSMFEEGLVDISDAECHAEIIQRIHARAATTTAGEWIITTPVGEPHYFLRRSYRDLAEGCLPDRWILDRAAPDHPVWIQAWAPTTPNVTVFNSAGLAAIGVTRRSGQELHRVLVERDEKGEPTGRLFGSVNNYYNNEPWWDSVLLKFPKLTHEQVLSAARRGFADANRRGITTIYEAHLMDFETIDVYRTLRDKGELRVRVSCVPDAELPLPPFSHPGDFPANLPAVYPITNEQYEARLRRALAATERDDELFRMEGVFLVNEGPVEEGLMSMYSAYRGPYGEVTSGIRFFPPERLRRAMDFCAENGLRLNFIAGGSRGHDDFLDLLEDVARRHPEIRERHWILEHAYLVDQHQARRYARLGIDVTTSCSFTWGEGKVFRDRMGPQVLPDLIPLRRLLDAGLKIAGGTDWGPAGPFEHIELAQTHRMCGTDERNDGPAQVVTRLEALRMWTSEAARVLQWPKIGTLAAGSHADFIVVDRDPVTCEPGDLAATSVLATAFGGSVVHDTGLMKTIGAGAGSR